MTLWAGIYARHQGAPLAPWADELAQGLSRYREERVQLACFDRAVLVYAETGAFPTASVCSSATGTTIISGEPLLAGSGAADRSGDLARLHRAWSAGDFAVTAQATGTFAGVHYNQAKSSLSIVADKIGVRPVYFAVTHEYVVVATALRMLEALPSLPKVIDLRGASELVALGYPLADRTPYRAVFTIRDGEVVTFQGRSMDRQRYWRIEQLRENPEPLEAVARDVHVTFVGAIEQRLGGDRHGVAFLSGGLDSRCLVAELLARGIELHTFNFANDGTKDQVLGDAFAQAAGTIHSRLPRPADPVRWSMTMAAAWEASPHRKAHPVERPQIVWSGDGGSVGLGFVGVYPSVIERLRARQRDEAVEEYFRQHQIALPLRVFRRELGAELRDSLHQSVREAFDEVRCEEDPGRELYFFRMRHDQRRHLALHFEDADLHRLELQLPFYDAALVAKLAAAPVDYGVRHRLYHAALQYFSPAIKTVAWQTYPGHEPCPIPLPDDAVDQWGDRQRALMRQRRRATILREAFRLARSASFPRGILAIRHFLAAAALHQLGRGDYGYVLEYAMTFEKLWRVSAGRWSGVGQPEVLNP